MTSIWKWESGNLQIKKSLLDGLQITETAKEVISVVGAGGKTTTIRRLTDEMEKRQKNVAVTTTTRMKKEPHFLLGADAERITQRWGQTHQVWFGEQDDNPEKVRGVSEALLDEVKVWSGFVFDRGRRSQKASLQSTGVVGAGHLSKKYTGAGSLRSGRSGKVLSGGVFSSRAGSRNFGEEDNRPDISSGYCAAGT